MFEHLEATADEAWGAELDGQLVGYARSIRRSDTRELTEFFTRPESQGQGVGRQLLVRAFPADVPHRSILATSDPAGLSRYLRHGFRATTAVYEFGGRPTAAPAPMLDGLATRPMAEVPSDERLSLIASVDDAILGARRDTDHAWLAARGRGWLLMPGDMPVGYAYGGTRLGPIATLDPRDMPDAIGVVEADALATSDEPLSLTVPLANVAVPTTCWVAGTAWIRSRCTSSRTIRWWRPIATS